VRALIVATRLYTGRAVDVIAFSLGVPVSRKAILGGYCVDSGEYLGGPLTKFIDTFVGVAGPNHGITLQDINRQVGYEGKHIFSIHSKKDQVVGHIVCGK
ncbi:triacylglycerol lipase, partial [Cooperia oncophora]